MQLFNARCALACAASLALAAAAQAQVVISQVFGFGGGYLAGTYVEIPPQGGVPIPAGDFVELFNPTGAPVDLTGWSLQWAGPSGTLWAKYDFAPGTIMASQKYLMIKIDTPVANNGLNTNPDFTAPLRIPATQDSNNLITDSGRVALMSNATLLTNACPVADATPGIIDFFGYNVAVCSQGAPAPTGTHLFLQANTFQRRNSGCQNTQNNAADFITGPFVARNGSSPALNQTIFITPSSAPSFTTTGFTVGNSITFSAALAVGGCTPGALNNGSATIDLSNLGGSPTQAMTVVGANGTFAHVIPGTLTAGSKSVTITSTDTDGRQGTTTFNVAIYTSLPTLTQDFGTASGNTWTATSGELTYLGGEVKWFKVVLPDVNNSTNGAYFDVDLEGSNWDDGGSPSTDGYLVLYNATGLKMAEDDDSGSEIRPQLTFGGGSRPPVGNGSPYNGRNGNLTAGAYYIAAFHWDSAQTVDQGFRIDATTGATGTMFVNVRYGVLNPPTPPATFTDLGIIPADGVFVTGSGAVTAAAQVKWFKFEIIGAVDSAARTYLDADSETSTGITATAIGLFKVADGVMIAVDRDSGTDALSRLTFGRGGRHPVGNGVAYNGSSGATLAAGQYYIALTEDPAAFANGWSAQSSGTTAAGTLVIRIRTGTQLRPNEVGSDTVNLGIVSNLAAPIVSASVPLGQADVRWFRFTTLQDTNATDKYLDLDVNGSNLLDDGFGVNDTMMSLYRSDGTVRSTTDDDGGRLSALSYGQTTPIRSYPNVTEGNGRDGQLVAGTYYLVVTGYQLTSASDFNATSDFGQPGNSVVVNIASNLSTNACNAADVAGLGGSVGADHLLTPDDIIVYLDAFFAANVAIADIAVLGGAPGHDGMITPDDLIYFLSQFFLPCN